MTVSAHTITAHATIPGSPERPALAPISAACTMDERWSPYIQAEIVTPIPTNDALARVDPRNRVRVQVTLQQKFGTSLPASALTVMLSPYAYPDTFYPDELYPA